MHDIWSGDVLGKLSCSSIRLELDGDARIQLHALRLKIQYFTLLLIGRMGPTMASRPHVLHCHWVIVVATPVQHLKGLRPSPHQHSRVVLGLDHGILDRFLPALTAQTRPRRVGQSPVDLADRHVLHGG